MTYYAASRMLLEESFSAFCLSPKHLAKLQALPILREWYKG
jgi:hypothetical protein